MSSEIDWKEVEERLKKRDKKLYYVGGTLSVTLDNERFVALNLDGGGFDQNSIKLEQPNSIREMIRRLYLEIKGKTTYYEEEVLNES